MVNIDFFTFITLIVKDIQILQSLIDKSKQEEGVGQVKFYPHDNGMWKTF